MYKEMYRGKASLIPRPTGMGISPTPPSKRVARAALQGAMASARLGATVVGGIASMASVAINWDIPTGFEELTKEGKIRSMVPVVTEETDDESTTKGIAGDEIAENEIELSKDDFPIGLPDFLIGPSKYRHPRYGRSRPGRSHSLLPVTSNI